MKSWLAPPRPRCRADRGNWKMSFVSRERLCHENINRHLPGQVIARAKSAGVKQQSVSVSILAMPRQIYLKQPVEKYFKPLSSSWKRDRPRAPSTPHLFFVPSPNLGLRRMHLPVHPSTLWSIRSVATRLWVVFSKRKYNIEPLPPVAAARQHKARAVQRSAWPSSVCGAR